ncbi:lysyl-tRNA synthetase [Rhodococcus rhodochrous]|uniref:bifunctional lysylphosphatidylglycerol flippase/synthetase MprF n=1 Tax=Rhodococcus rhodochrous TaxID=1829 RepID=UPI000B2DCD3A|nr:phosphatidylglycerol lysyltransferase domain-containing protein [Rhodococcus rhodochrous]SNV24329.1 lysyl-tRNA synthetase [Rhodococcus rhodochrous]
MTTLQTAAASATPGVQRMGLRLYLLAMIVLEIAAFRSGRDTKLIVALAVAIAFVARGVWLRRPVTRMHAVAALLCLLVAGFAYAWGHSHVAFVAIAVSGPVLVLPVGSRPEPEEEERIASLVRESSGDPLAPFALNSTKSYFYNSGRTAAIGYRTRAGIAVVSGDPVGHPPAFDNLLSDFTRFASDRGWRVAVLGAGENTVRLWQSGGRGRPRLRSVCIGCDVIVDVGHFTLVGRRFRNLRQAVHRAENAGVTTEIVAERDLSPEVRSQLLDIVAHTRSGHQRRGFSMILDHLLDGTYPDMMIVIARDRDMVPVGFQRYGLADHGEEWSLDVPWRSPRAPNGTDERMAVAVIDHVRSIGGTSVSLAFAPFPDLLGPNGTGRWRSGVRMVLRLGDSIIALESLYRYLDKFHAGTDRRFVLFKLRYLLPAAFAMLTFEFVPHREYSARRDDRP